MGNEAAIKFPFGDASTHKRQYKSKPIIPSWESFKTKKSERPVVPA